MVGFRLLTGPCRALPFQYLLDAMPLCPEPITQVGHKNPIAHTAKRRSLACLLVAVDRLGKPGAVESRPYWRDRRLQVRIADRCHLLEEGRLYRSTLESRQLPGDSRVVDFIVDEGIRQRRPYPDALVSRQNTSHSENSSSSSSRVSAAKLPAIPPAALPASTTAMAQKGAPGPQMSETPRPARNPPAAPPPMNHAQGEAIRTAGASPWPC